MMMVMMMVGEMLRLLLMMMEEVVMVVMLQRHPVVTQPVLGGLRQGLQHSQPAPLSLHQLLDGRAVLQLDVGAILCLFLHTPKSCSSNVARAGNALVRQSAGYRRTAGSDRWRYCSLLQRDSKRRRRLRFGWRALVLCLGGEEGGQGERLGLSTVTVLGKKNRMEEREDSKRVREHIHNKGPSIVWHKALLAVQPLFVWKMTNNFLKVKAFFFIQPSPGHYLRMSSKLHFHFFLMYIHGVYVVLVLHRNENKIIYLPKFPVCRTFQLLSEDKCMYKFLHMCVSVQYTWALGFTGIGLIRLGFPLRMPLPPICLGSEVD